MLTNILNSNITIKTSVLIIVFLPMIIFGGIYFSGGKAPFYKLCPENQQKIKEKNVLYKKINVKFDILFFNTFNSYEKLSRHDISLLLGNEIVDFDDPQFFDLTSIIKHKFDNLDNNLKDKIYNSIFLFNNEPFKFDFISKLYPEILYSLTSDQILSILNGQIIKVGQIAEEIKPLNSLEKKNDFASFFLEYLKLSEKHYEIINRGSLDKIINEDSNKFTFFILKQEDLNNQIISFELNSIAKLKKKFPKYWISYIDLQECLKYLNENVNLENPISILNQFVNLSDNFEKQLFLMSYKSGKTILLWDKFDEIPLKYRKFIVNLISFINQNTFNVQVISAQLSFENLKEEDQNTIKRSLVRYKNVLLKLNELFPKNSDIYTAMNPVHASKILSNEILNLGDQEFEYLEEFINHSWDSLDKSLTHKILNSELMFQDNKIKFKLIDQLYPEIFTSLTSEQICLILDEKLLEIGKMVKSPIDPNYLDEKIESIKSNDPDEQICSNNSFWDYLEEFKFLKDEYELVRNENLGEFIKIDKPQSRQFFILTLETSLEVIKGFDQNSIQNIKEKYPFHWIAYINRLTFNKYVEKHNHCPDPLLMLENMFSSSFESEFEKDFIKSSYNSGGFIFFWDGFFETSLETNEDIIQIISLIYNNTQNIHFISSQLFCENRTKPTEEEPRKLLSFLHLLLKFWSDKDLLSCILILAYMKKQLLNMKRKGIKFRNLGLPNRARLNLLSLMTHKNKTDLLSGTSETRLRRKQKKKLSQNR